ncbi:hypothetical protein BD560DRAFT_422380 [Blakeslea trispora]|nr:hypothetical protein BD560DRAFT_422380 [Blakeslea trispora]
MNDIFIFDTDVNMSISKYFRKEDHSAIISSLNTKRHRPEMGVKAHQWLSLFIFGCPDRSVKDSLVYNYLSQILTSIFSKDGRFKIKCAWRVQKITNYTAIESDRVKLGKQMRTINNELVLHRVPNPIVCGIICQGDDIFTYYMDMVSLKLYRIVKVLRVKLFRSMEELYFLAYIISSIVKLKNITLETTMKAETSLIEPAGNNHRNPSMPLSFESYRLRRKRKRNSPSNE